MKKIALMLCSVLFCLAITAPTGARAGEIDMEVLVDNRIADMGIPENIKSCVKQVTMDELRRRGSIQTYLLDLIIRKIIAEASRYCRER